jgi:nucleolin
MALVRHFFFSWPGVYSPVCEFAAKRKAAEASVVPPKKLKLANGNATPGITAGQEESKSVFVGKLSWNVDDQWLSTEFAECGEVVSAHVQTDRNTGQSRGFGYVHFTTAEAAQKALDLDGKEIDGRPIRVDVSTPPDKSKARENRAKTFGDAVSEPSETLFVGNLSFSTVEDTLYEAFGEYGSVKNVRLPTDRETGNPKGFGYVEFSDIEEAKKAFEAMSGKDVDGRSIRVDFTKPRDAGGYSVFFNTAFLLLSS